MDSTLPRYWAGNLYGTDTANLFVDLTPGGEGFEGTARVSRGEAADVGGIKAHWFNGHLIILPGDPAQPFKANLEVLPNGSLWGTWEGKRGHAGIIALHPHAGPAGFGAASQSGPQQLFTANRSLGALRLYDADVRQVIETMTADLSSKIVVATYGVGKDVRSEFAPDFLARGQSLGTISTLKLGASEQQPGGLANIITVDLDSSRGNSVQVQGPQEAWVMGTATAIERELRKRQKFLISTYREHGLSINAVGTLAMLVALPSIEAWQNRALFVAVIVAVLWGLAVAHRKTVPLLQVRMIAEPTGVLRRWFPSVASALWAVVAAVLVATVLAVIQKWSGLPVAAR